VQCCTTEGTQSGQGVRARRDDGAMNVVATLPAVGEPSAIQPGGVASCMPAGRAAVLSCGHCSKAAIGSAGSLHLGQPVSGVRGVGGVRVAFCALDLALTCESVACARCRRKPWCTPSSMSSGIPPPDSPTANPSRHSSTSKRRCVALVPFPFFPSPSHWRLHDLTETPWIDLLAEALIRPIQNQFKSNSLIQYCGSTNI